MINMLKQFLLSLLIIATISPIESKWLSCFNCPTSDAYGPQCLDSVTPPWPICLLHSVDYWVDSAIDSATRCCGDDLSECNCPKKDSPDFLAKIGAYCDGVATCDDQSVAIVANENPNVAEE